MVDRIEKRLWAMQDEAYRRFQAGLLPGVAPERIIGVRTPLLRRLAKELAGTEAAEAFLSDLTHAYYDENNLHGLILNEGRSYAETVERVNRFLPFVDNWATCDLLRPKAFCRNRAALREEIDGWLAAKEPFTIPGPTTKRSKRRSRAPASRRSRKRSCADIDEILPEKRKKHENRKNQAVGFRPGRRCADRDRAVCCF